MSKLTLKIVSNQGHQQKFLRDPKSDIIVILKDKIYPLHRQIIKDSIYLSTFKNQSEKVHLIDVCFDYDLFEKILAYFYGFELSIERNSKILKVLEIVKYLKIQQLQEQILSDIRQSFQDYDIFSLLCFALENKFCQIIEKCYEELEFLDFQQVFINKFSLLQCKKQFFQFIIKQYQNHKSSKSTEGIKIQQLTKLITQYQQINKSSINLQSNSTTKYQQLKQKKISRKRSSTWCNRNTPSLQTYVSSFSSSSCCSSHASQNIVYRNLCTDKKSKDSCNSMNCQDQVKDLKSINKNMKINNNSLKQQLKQLKLELNSVEKYSSNQEELEILEEKFQEFEEFQAKNNQKLEKLMSQVEKLSEELSSTEGKSRSQKQFLFIQETANRPRPRQKSQNITIIQ